MGISIDNVSVREVGQDWTLGTGWSIAEELSVLRIQYSNANRRKCCNKW